MELSDTERRLALILALDFWSITQVAYHLGHNRSWVYRRLKRPAFSKLVEDLRHQRMARLAGAALAVIDADHNRLFELDKPVTLD